MGSREVNTLRQRLENSIFAPGLGGQLRAHVQQGFAEIMRVVNGIEEALVTIYGDDDDQLQATALMLINLGHDLTTVLGRCERSVPIIETVVDAVV